MWNLFKKKSYVATIKLDEWPIDEEKQKEFNELYEKAVDLVIPKILDSLDWENIDKKRWIDFDFREVMHNDDWTTHDGQLNDFWKNYIFENEEYEELVNKVRNIWCEDDNCDIRIPTCLKYVSFEYLQNKYDFIIDVYLPISINYTRVSLHFLDKAKIIK